MTQRIQDIIEGRKHLYTPSEQILIHEIISNLKNGTGTPPNQTHLLFTILDGIREEIMTNEDEDDGWEPDLELFDEITQFMTDYNLL